MSPVSLSEKENRSPLHPLIHKRPNTYMDLYGKRVKNNEGEAHAPNLVPGSLSGLNNRMAQLTISKALISFNPCATNSANLHQPIITETHVTTEEIVVARRIFIHIKRTARKAPHLRVPISNPQFLTQNFLNPVSSSPPSSLMNLVITPLPRWRTRCRYLIHIENHCMKLSWPCLGDDSSVSLGNLPHTSSLHPFHF